MSGTAVIDNGLSNIDSVVRALKEVGATPYVVGFASEIGEPDHIVLPGVGSFFDGMSALNRGGLKAELLNQVDSYAVPLLGICLGMQMLATAGAEGGQSEGLGLLPGIVAKLEQDGGSPRIPHIGWNELHQVRSIPLLKGIPTGTDFYFVHSYHFQPADSAMVVATRRMNNGSPSSRSRSPRSGKKGKVRLTSHPSRRTTARAIRRKRMTWK